MENSTNLGQPLPHVNPGGLITADWMNNLVDTVNDLQTQLANLEGKQPNGNVVITALIFTSPLCLGDPLEIRGQNFGFSSGAQQVRFGDVNITEFRPGSSDTRLLVTVPSFANFSESGRNVTLFVGNGVSSTTRTLNINPVDRPVSGNLVDVIWETISPNPPLAEQKLRIGYRLHSRVGATRIFTITPIILPTALQSGVKILDENETLIADGRIQLGSLAEKLFFIQLPTIPKDTGFTATVSAVSGGVAGSASRNFTAGVSTIRSGIDLSVSSFSAVDDPGDPLPDGGSYSYDANTNTIHLRAGAFGHMDLQATFEQVGTYAVTLDPPGVMNGWTKNLGTAASIKIEESDFTGTPKRATSTIRINLQTDSGSTASQFKVRVQLAGATVDEQIKFQLARLI